jgi:hypothetical protein
LFKHLFERRVAALIAAGLERLFGQSLDSFEHVL